MYRLVKIEFVDRDIIEIVDGNRTWLKYSSAILLAHSTQLFNGRVGFDTSAHLITILLTSTTFSGCSTTDMSKESEEFCVSLTVKVSR